MIVVNNVEQLNINIVLLVYVKNAMHIIIIASGGSVRKILRFIIYALIAGLGIVAWAIIAFISWVTEEGK